MMTIRPECYDCLLRLIEQTVQAATAEVSLQAEARRQARTVLAAEFGPEAIPAIIANHFHPIIQAVTGNPDPFLARKRRETALARQVASALPRLPNPDLPSLLSRAAAGNSLDFFRPAAEIARDMANPAKFYHSDYDQLAKCLRNTSGLLLYLADNAGEQFFDLPLVTGLRTQGWQVYYIVKGAPIQNDLTREDLAESGLLPALEPVVDTGAATVGLELSLTNRTFQDLWQAADVILAKGMGHFETLSRLAEPRLFFLLQAKCAPVALALDVPLGAFVLRRAHHPSPGIG